MVNLLELVAHRQKSNNQWIADSDNRKIGYLSHFASSPCSLKIHKCYTNQFQIFCHALTGYLNWTASSHESIIDIKTKAVLRNGMCLPQTGIFCVEDVCWEKGKKHKVQKLLWLLHTASASTDGDDSDIYCFSCWKVHYSSLINPKVVTKPLKKKAFTC